MPLTTETFLQPLSFLLTPAFYVTLTGWSLTIFFRLDLSSQSAICHCLPRAAITSVCDHCCFIFSNMVLDTRTDLIEGTPVSTEARENFHYPYQKIWHEKSRGTVRMKRRMKPEEIQILWAQTNGWVRWLTKNNQPVAMSRKEWWSRPNKVTQ